MWAYMTAKDDEKQIELYCYDLVWKLVQLKLASEIPSPSEIWNSEQKKDTRTAKQVMMDVVNGLG